MPSPRPTGSGALKILLFPQLLEYHVFYFVTLPGYPIEPILGLLLRVVGICYGLCHLYGLVLLVVVMHLGETCLATARLVPAMLRAVVSNMPLLAADIAGDICEARSPTSCQKPSPWWRYSSPSSSASGYKEVVRLILCGYVARSRSVRRRIHGIGMSSGGLKCSLIELWTARGTLKLI